MSSRSLSNSANRHTSSVSRAAPAENDTDRYSSSDRHKMPNLRSRPPSTLLQPFRPYRGKPQDPIDICVDAFLSSRSFELTCVQAVQLAAILPSQPPPTQFTSFDRTPMHPWYQAILMEFVDCFMRRLRTRGIFPVRIVVTPGVEGYKLTTVEDAEAFNRETNAHINAILLSFNTRYPERARGSMSGLAIDTRQVNATEANGALYEATSRADYPPKRDWRVGEPLASDHRKRLRMFEGGVLRLLADREDERWLLGLPDRLNRGIAAYKEYYIRHLRQEIISSRQKQQDSVRGDDVFT